MNRKGLCGVWLALLLLVGANGSCAVQPATVLRSMETEWNKIRSFRAELVQIHRNPEGEVIAQYLGSLAVSRPNRVRIDYHEVPAGVPYDSTAEKRFTHTLFSDDGLYLYEYNAIENVLSRDEYGGVSAVPFIEAVAGVSEFEVENFRKEYWVAAPVPEEKIGDLDVYVISAQPERAYREIRQPFEVWIGRDDKIPRRILLRFPEETVELKVLEFEVNPVLDNEYFDFRVPEDVQAIDRTRGF